jgi:hypothetical protein
MPRCFRSRTTLGTFALTCLAIPRALTAMRASEMARYAGREASTSPSGLRRLSN